MVKGVKQVFCTQCGAQLQEGSKYCHQCGHRLQPGRSTLTLDENAFELDSPERQEKIRQLLNEALTCEAEGRFQEAILACEGVLVLDPGNTSAHSLLGLIYEKQGDLRKAAAEYEKVVTLNPDSVADRAKLEEVRRRLRMPVAAPPRETANPLPLVIGAFVSVGLFVAGLAALNYQSKPKPAPPSQPVQLQPATPTANYPAYPGYYPAITTPQTATTLPQNTPAPAPPQRPNTASSLRPERLPLPPLPPMTVAPPTETNGAGTPSNSRPVRNTQNSPATEPNSVVMPDVPLQSSTPPAPPARQPVIEINVRNPAPSNGSPIAPPSPVMEAQELIRVAQQHQLAGRYRDAIPLYQKALEGASDRGFIYQQIGLCYQRLGELESARNAYQQAIAEYERQIAANQNVERARRGLEAARQGLAACGG